MCGIFGYIGHRKDSVKLVLSGLKNLEYRGYDSWGVAVVPDSGKQQIVVKKRVGKIGSATVNELPSGTLSIGHTRWATHGGVIEVNAHPHLDCEGNIAVIHNGIFENYEEIKEELVKKGHTFISQTDTEVIVHEIEEKQKKMEFIQAVRQTFLAMKGLNAIIVINNVDREMVVVRDGSPLVIGCGREENFLSSDPAALLPYTKEVYYLEDREMAVVRADKINVFEVDSQKIQKIAKQTLEWDSAQTRLGKYPHYMLKEIYEQPKILLQIARSSGKYIQEIANKLKKAESIYLAGCGSASYEAMMGNYLFAKIANLKTNVVVGSEFSNELKFVNKKTSVVALSQSGETMDLLEPLKIVKARGATLIAIVNVLGSSLYRLADEKILIGAGPEKAVASTKAFTAKTSELILLSYAVASRFSEGREVVERASMAVAKVLSKESIKKIQRLAKLLIKSEHLYVVGRGISYPLALESALKIKEVSYIHAEGLAGGELKHGTLALIEKGTPFIVFLPDNETYQATLSGAIEMKARGGYMIGVSSKPHPLFDEYIEIEDAGVGTVLPGVAFAQLLSYYMSVALRLDPDMPRNLAKSVTVK